MTRFFSYYIAEDTDCNKLFDLALYLNDAIPELDNYSFVPNGNSFRLKIMLRQQIVDLEAFLRIVEEGEVMGQFEGLEVRPELINS
ncbi:MAG: hypothetical protein ABIJ18_03715 [archaeon]